MAEHEHPAAPPPANVETPDYEDEKPAKSFKNFIAAWGKKYDGDPRLGFITAGLLGTWGEWHTYPKGELIGVEGGAGGSDGRLRSGVQGHARTAALPGRGEDLPEGEERRPQVRYHDDSFAWATLDTGKKDDNWFYMPALKAAGAEDKWKTHPIGGEIPPEAWGKVFDDKPGDKQVSELPRVRGSHSRHVADGQAACSRRNRMPKGRSGPKSGCGGWGTSSTAPCDGRFQAGKVDVKLEVENRGVAPFYYNWQAEWGLLLDGKPAKAWPASGRLTGLLPATNRGRGRTRSTRAGEGGPIHARRAGAEPAEGGKPLRFANATQGDEWLTLGAVEVK